MNITSEQITINGSPCVQYTASWPEENNLRHAMAFKADASITASELRQRFQDWKARHDAKVSA